MTMNRRFRAAVAAGVLAAVFPVLALAVLATDASTAKDTAKASSSASITFTRAFGAPPDGSWDGLFSGDNVIDPIQYATTRPEKKVFKSAQYALSSTTAGTEIWYGTAASVWCYWPFISMRMPGTGMLVQGTLSSP